MIRLDMLCGEGRLSAAGLSAAAPVTEFTRVDERHGTVTLLAEVRAR